MDPTSLRRSVGWASLVVGVLGVLVLTATGRGTWALGLVVAAPVLLLIQRRPQLGLLILVALAPFDGLRVLVEVPVVGAAWKFVFAGIVLVATFVCPLSARGERGRRLPSWCLPLFALVVVGLVSAASVGLVQGGVGLKLDFAYLLVAWAAWRCPLDAVERDRLVTVLMVTGLIGAVVGLLEQFAGATALHNLGYPYNTSITYIGNSLRSFSTFDNAPAFALFIMIVIVMGLPAALSDRSRPRNIAFLVLLPVYALGLGSAFSRSALVGLAAGLLYLGIKRYRIVLAGLPIVLVAFLIFGGNVTETLSSSTSLTQRTSGWEENIHQVAAHPFGAGIGAVGSAALTVDQLTGAISPSYQPDNYYFKEVYELGPLGLWLLILLLVGAFATAARASDRESGDDRAFADGVTAAIVAAVVAAMFTTYLEIFPMDLMFWLLLTVVSTMGAVPRVRSSAAPVAAAL